MSRHQGETVAATEFNIEVLAKQVYLSSAEAAFYIGYRAPDYPNPRKAFMKAVARISELYLAKGYWGTRLRFRRSDLDRYIQHGGRQQ